MSTQRWAHLPIESSTAVIFALTYGKDKAIGEGSFHTQMEMDSSSHFDTPGLMPHEALQAISCLLDLFVPPEAITAASRSWRSSIP